MTTAQGLARDHFGGFSMQALKRNHCNSQGFQSVQLPENQPEKITLHRLLAKQEGALVALNDDALAASTSLNY